MYKIIGKSGQQYGPVTAEEISCLPPQAGAFMAVAGALMLVGATVGVILFFFDPRRYHFYPTCFFHQTTGLLCAGCGALRALHQLLHGHLLTALRFNPLVVLSLPVIAGLGFKMLVQKAQGQRVSVGLRPLWIWVGLAVLAVFTVVRNLPGMPFAALPQ